MSSYAPYACRICGVDSYRRLSTVGADGQRVATGLFHCSQCSVVFADPHDWRGCPEPEPEPLPLPLDPRRETSVDIMRRYAKTPES